MGEKVKLIDLSINRLIPWSGIKITPDLKTIIGIGRKGIFIYHWPYRELAFEDRGIVILEKSSGAGRGKHPHARGRTQAVALNVGASRGQIILGKELDNGF